MATMRRFPWSDNFWTPSEQAMHATREGQVYSVRVAVDPAGALPALWQRLSGELAKGEASGDEEGQKLYDGGSTLTIADAGCIDIVSGGEDVLDSLSWSINQTLPEAAATMDTPVALKVVTEGYPPLSKS